MKKNCFFAKKDKKIFSVNFRRIFRENGSSYEKNDHDQKNSLKAGEFEQETQDAPKCILRAYFDAFVESAKAQFLLILAISANFK